MRSVLVLLGAAFLGTTALAGCQSTADKTGQSSEGFYAPDYDTLWDITRRELNRAGFTADIDESSKENRVMVSRWNTQLAPFSMRGHREQATVTLVPIPSRPDYWSVQ